VRGLPSGIPVTARPWSGRPDDVRRARCGDYPPDQVPLRSVTVFSRAR
jgi:hypothetical protein